MYDSNPYFYGTGRRKSSVARVRVYAGIILSLWKNSIPRLR